MAHHDRHDREPIIHFAYQAQQGIAQRIRRLYRASLRDLDRVAMEIIQSVEAYETQGVLTAEQACQLMFDVRNEQSRINR